MNKNKWGIIFHFSFASLWATEDKSISGKILKWDTREEAEEYGGNNCGLNFFEAREIKIENIGDQTLKNKLINMM
jgi:hypothetical protein